ncbi:NADPH-dependent FMN reductase [Oceanithermus profundus DSM 14977]|uniref:NADPH-dependent FMN reductase n=1 Tax=Oceanithermus profundus (strain DSM 14977 / NBRC 100410 / VKM B-2274 / 506) TaxID=670487 RepID=E4U6J9_OCEP5|nr:NADPH-dependent FMN reductase [Oceanithermus profundus]ADR35685.1 NADPH-dependent FMN reductase [Oceanithermus profundus DSM 14977]
MNVLGISGSLRAASTARAALALALEGAAAAGTKTELLDLRELDLPLYDEDETRYTPAQRAATARLQEAAEAADAFLFASPEYHGGLSGVLKNAIDHLAGRHFRGKAAGIVAVAGGRVAPVSTALMLRTVLRQLGAYTIPQQVLLPEAEKLFDADGNLADEELARRLEDLGAQVVRLARALAHSS